MEPRQISTVYRLCSYLLGRNPVSRPAVGPTRFPVQCVLAVIILRGLNYSCVVPTCHIYLIMRVFYVHFRIRLYGVFRRTALSLHFVWATDLV